MKVTTQQFAKSVKGWLEEEKASVVQAMQLQAALEAGAINGGNYQGHRTDNADQPYEDVMRFRRSVFHTYIRNDDLLEDENEKSCGCLVDTLERIKGNRPFREMRTASGETFWLATLIGRGETPSSSKWARAAVRGIAQYIAALEVAA